MQDYKLSTRVLLISALIMLVILITGPFGYKFGVVPLMPSLASLMVAFVGGLIVLLISLGFVVVALRNQQLQDRNLLIVTAAICLVPSLVMLPQIMLAQSVPPIHDITTDTANPPQFDVIVKHRAFAPNSLDYGSKELPAEELASMQQEAYPVIKPILTDLDEASAVARAAEVLKELGIEVVNVDEASGIVEGTATTFWFGFKDDVVVRVSPDEAGSLVDVRSISRVGQSDLGANARRIVSILEAF